MSEDFDREAEKERLREKFEAEEESRRSTEHMSELLLKGATMTNRHCDTCGDPIFRYDGQMFCPTCEEVVEEDGAGGETAPDADEESTVDEEIDATSGAEAEASTGAASAGEDSPTDPSAESTGETEPAREPGGADEAAARGPGADTEAGTGRQPEGSRTTSMPRSPESAGDLGEARASLVRTLSDLAARAEAAEDVRRTRDLLAAAREAAEAIGALDRADR